MNEESTPKSPASFIRKRWKILLTAGLLLAVFGSMLPPESEEVKEAKALYTVAEGPLTISVTASGTVRSSNAQVIQNKVEGMTAIIWIIPEGTQVKKGDKLLELDSSKIKDEVINQQIDVETATSELTNAQEAVELAEKQGEADIDAAKVDLRLALLDLEKYTGQPVWQTLGWPKEKYRSTQLPDVAEQLSQVAWDDIDLSASLNEGHEGEYAQEIQTAVSEVQKLQMKLSRTQDKFVGSSNLLQKGYITQTEFESDELEYKTAELDLEVAKSKQRLLAEYTRKRRLAELMSAVDQKAFSLEKAIHQAQSNLRSAQSKLGAHQENYNREVRRLKEDTAQLEACVVYAPSDGMVVYGTTGQDRYDRNQPLAEGVEVRERQDLFRLPASDDMTADVKIHESALEKVREGLTVKITTDAFPGTVFKGEVTKVALMPDSQNRWLNPDLTVYNSEVSIVGTETPLRPGMSCQAEIVVQQYDSVVFVPVQSVIKIDGKSSVFVTDKGGRAKPRPVEVGLDNNRMVHIKSGVDVGEVVLLNPPLPEGAKPQGDAEEAPAKETLNNSSEPTRAS